MVDNNSTAKHPGRRRRNYAIILFVVLLAAMIGAYCFLQWSFNYYGPGPVEIELVPDKPFYLQGENITVSIYVNNEQNWPVPFPTTLIYPLTDGNTTMGNKLYIDYAAPPPTFPAHSRTLYRAMSWNEMSASLPAFMQKTPGNYTFTVRFEGSVDYGNGSRCIIEIQPNSN